MGLRLIDFAGLSESSQIQMDNSSTASLAPDPGVHAKGGGEGRGEGRMQMVKQTKLPGDQEIRNPPSCSFSLLLVGLEGIPD